MLGNKLICFLLQTEMGNHQVEVSFSDSFLANSNKVFWHKSCYLSVVAKFGNIIKKHAKMWAPWPGELLVKK